MGAESGDVIGKLTDEQNIRAIEGLLQNVAAQVDIPDEPPADEQLPKTPTSRHRVETGD